jgi:hypothetical protein
VVALAFLFLAPTMVGASFWGAGNERSFYDGLIYACNVQDFSPKSYRESVRWIMGAFEARTGRNLVPGEKHRVGIKIYTASGEGLRTPPELIRAVVAELEARGFSRTDIFLLDANAQFMRDSGYLPPLSKISEGALYEGLRVRVLDDGSMYDDVWFYDNPLPSALISESGLRIVTQPEDSPEDEQSSSAPPSEQPAPGSLADDGGEGRKSFLPAPLINDVDFWINLPVLLDHRTMEISCALANASLWNVSNRERFFGSPANAPVAMAEIAAIPELNDNWALTILSLEYYQFVGGPVFNSNYVRSDPVIIGGSDPAIIDAWGARRLNAYRESEGFERINLPPYACSFAKIVGIGACDTDKILWLTPPGTTPNPALTSPDKVAKPRPKSSRSGLFWQIQ